MEVLTSIKLSMDYSVGERVRVCLGCKVRISEEFTSTEDHEVPLALSGKCCFCKMYPCTNDIMPPRFEEFRTFV